MVVLVVQDQFIIHIEDEVYPLQGGLKRPQIPSPEWTLHCLLHLGHPQTVALTVIAHQAPSALLNHCGNPIVQSHEGILVFLKSML